METATFIVYGASDDLVEVEGALREEFDLPRSGPWRGALVAPDHESLIVEAEFCPSEYPDAEWVIRVVSAGSYPSWPIRFGERPDREGDPAVEIDAPAGTRLEVISEED